MQTTTDTGGQKSSNVAAGRRPVVDFHAHILVPEVYKVTAAHSLFVKSFADPTMSEEAKRNAQKRVAYVEHAMAETTARVASMDAMGVGVQVLSSSLVHQCTCGFEPQEALRLDRILNDRIARIAAANPRRFVGLGSLPLHAPALAV